MTWRAFRTRVEAGFEFEPTHDEDQYPEWERLLDEATGRDAPRTTRTMTLEEFRGAV